MFTFCSQKERLHWQGILSKISPKCLKSISFSLFVCKNSRYLYTILKINEKSLFEEHMKWKLFIKRLNERKVNNTQIQLCWNLTWYVNRKNYFCLFPEREINKQNHQMTHQLESPMKFQSNKARVVYLVTCSQADMSIVPDPRKFADIVVGIQQRFST